MKFYKITIIGFLLVAVSHGTELCSAEIEVGIDNKHLDQEIHKGTPFDEIPMMWTWDRDYTADDAQPFMVDGGDVAWSCKGNWRIGINGS